MYVVPLCLTDGLPMFVFSGKKRAAEQTAALKYARG